MHKCTCVPEMTPRWPSARLVKHWKAARRIHNQSVSSFMHRSHETHRNGKVNHQVERCPFAFLPSCFFDTCSLMSCHFIVFSFGFHHAPPFSLVLQHSDRLLLTFRLIAKTWEPWHMGTLQDDLWKRRFFLFSLTLTWFPYFIDWTKLRMIVDKNLCPTIDISIQTPKLRVSQMGVVKIHHKCWNPNPINELSVASHQLSTKSAKSARTRAAPSMGAWRMSRLRPVLFRKDPETASVACLEQQTEGNRKGPKQPPSWFITFYSYVKWGLQRTCVELDRCMTV